MCKPRQIPATEICKQTCWWRRKKVDNRNAINRLLSTIKLIRTDTTLDLSQKAEKVCSSLEPGTCHCARFWICPSDSFATSLFVGVKRGVRAHTYAGMLPNIRRPTKTASLEYQVGSGSN